MGNSSLDEGTSSSPVQPSPAFSSSSASQGKRPRGFALPGGMPLPFGQVRFPARRVLLVSTLLALVLCSNVLANFPVVQPSTVFALAFKNPNPPIPTPSWLKPASGKPVEPNLGKQAPPANEAPQTVAPHRWPVTMQPASLTLSNAAQRFVGSDGALEVDLAAGSLEANQLAQASGGIQLFITQVEPGAGSTNGGDGQIFFGTYEFQFFDGTGKPFSGLHLLHPLTLRLHLRPDQASLLVQGQAVYTIWNAVLGSATPPVIPTPHTQTATGQGGLSGIMPLASTNERPTLTSATSSPNGLDWSVQSSFAPASGSSPSANASSTSPAAAAPASSIAFNTQAPQATWGTPTETQVALNAGGLSYTYPLTLPPGPGSFQPPLSLAYSSGSVNENHGWQSASPWVGQGWSLDMGEISWAQENVTPNGTAEIENVWHISDPSGLGGQSIPPDRTYNTAGASSTWNPSLSNLPTASNLSSSHLYVWQTAPDSHAKVRELQANSFPCFRAYLPDGTMEEFGCTTDSRESYKDSSSNTDVYSWKLDLMIDPYGNQIHLSYQQISVSGTIQDAVLKDITYDDPTCHNTTIACATWNPQVDLHFDAGQNVTNLLNSGCGNGTSTTRCDDPVNSTLPVPKVMSSYVLNDLKVEVGSNILREYVFSYNQGGPQTVSDPNTNQNESVAGYLTLGQI